MPWPLERGGVRAFADGLEEILVVEEKRAVIENQLKEQLYNWREDVRPRVVGKFDEDGEWLLPSYSELTPAAIARVIAARLERFVTSKRIAERLEFLTEKEADLARDVRPDFKRIPYFCAGCPHNTSTRVPDGSVAAAGIGCHYMVTWMDRDTTTFTHMGGEGANWNGIAPFTDTRHLFVNIGDGTYYHSGLLAIRAAVAAGVNVTYKVLYNDAVAMTGGQPVDGPLDAAMITRQVAAEGVGRIAVVADDPGKYPPGTRFADAVTLHERHDFDAVQRELRKVPGVSVLLFDQTCAAELRRRRKRGKAPDPNRRVFINAAVCEGCGDCGVKSNCVAIAPLETPFGRKRKIDQSACNKDMSCLDGFCPSLVTVEGGRLRKAATPVADTAPGPDLPEPAEVAIGRSYDIVVTGIGGSGVVTVGALIGMAAHLEGKAVSVLDQIGLAQKNGAVMSHVRIGEDDGAIFSQRIPAGGAHLLIGCDLVTAGGFEALSKLHDTHSRAVIDSQHTMTAAFTQVPDLEFPADDLNRAIVKTTLSADFVNASAIARAQFGDGMAANVMMIGYAYQKGLLPLSADSLERAIDINAVAVADNLRAFHWGRIAAADPRRAEAAIAGATGAEEAGTAPSPDLDDLIRHRAQYLKEYAGAALARRYEDRIARLRKAERERAPGADGLAAAAAIGYAKLLAAKDVYEVARLFTDKEFAADLARTFEGDWRLRFHLSPPFIAPRDPNTGAPRKMTFGPWMMAAFKVLAALKGLRDTPFDIFRLTPERQRKIRIFQEEGIICGHRICRNSPRAPL